MHTETLTEQYIAEDILKSAADMVFIRFLTLSRMTGQVAMNSG